MSLRGKQLLHKWVEKAKRVDNWAEIRFQDVAEEYCTKVIVLVCISLEIFGLFY